MSERHSPSSNKTRARLLDLWTGDVSYGHPLGCVATSFTFDAELFEEHCLARFLSIQTNPNETAKAYLIEREEKLSQCFACVLVDSAHVTASRSLRWHMLPIRIPGGGVLHAKLTLLVWENFIRILIGSANLTEPAYRSNQEVIATLDFGPQGNPAPALLSECIDFLHRVREFAPGFKRSDVGPQAALATFLAAVEQRARSYPAAKRQDAECVLVPLVRSDKTVPLHRRASAPPRGSKTVLQQLANMWIGPRPDRAWVLSPFFDEDARVGTAAAALGAVLNSRGKRTTRFVGAGRTLPDGTVQIDVPAALKDSSHPSLRHKFAVVEQRVEIDGKPVDRSLHAKSIWLEKDNRALYMLGSSNFTAAGLGLHPHHNIELNLAYIIRDRKSRFGKLCAQSWPSEIDLDDIESVQFLGGLPDSADNADVPRLPTAFGLALYYLDERGARLELEIGTDTPPIFSVLSAEQVVLLDGQAWACNGCARTLVLAWDAKRPPSSLEVRWQDDSGNEWSAPWIINVADMSVLPPPDELGSLSLSELIDILSSARPLHEIVPRIIQRRERPTPREENLKVDPHKSVDTSQFLLRRMRRVAQALEGMRTRLKQPVSSLDALRWRLRGPIGPVALAKQLSAEDPEGAAFMIAEVAATLRSVTWQPLGTLHRQAIGREVAEITRALQALARKAPASPSLASYVTASFEELLS